MNEKKDKEQKNMVMKFMRQMDTKYPDVKPCMAVGIGSVADDEDCIVCGRVYPEYKEECKKFTKLFGSLRERSKTENPKTIKPKKT